MKRAWENFLRDGNVPDPDLGVTQEYIYIYIYSQNSLGCIFKDSASYCKFYLNKIKTQVIPTEMTTRLNELIAKFHINKMEARKDFQEERKGNSPNRKHSIRYNN